MKEVIEQAVTELKKIILSYVKPGVSPFVLKDNLAIENAKDKALLEALVTITNEMSESLNIHDNNTQRYKINFDKLTSMIDVRTKERNVPGFLWGAGEYSELQNKCSSLLAFVTTLKNDSVRNAEEQERKKLAEDEKRRQLALDEAKLRVQDEANRIEKERLELEKARVKTDHEKTELLSIIKKQGEELTHLRTQMTMMQSQLGSSRADAPDPWKHISHIQPNGTNGNTIHKPAAPAIDAEIEFLTKRIGQHHTNLVRQLGMLAKTPAFESTVNRMIEDILINFEKPNIQGIHVSLSSIAYNDPVRDTLIKEALGKILTIEKAELSTPKLHEDAIAAILKKEQNDLTQNQSAENNKAKLESRPPKNYDHLTPQSQILYKLEQFVSGATFNGRKPIIFPEIPGLQQKLLSKKQELIDLKKANLPKAPAAPAAK